ncbi:hypothetical protein [Streptomyces sp. SM13]|nr:hypothetical protein [Streptomyces sp. SM13]
MARFLITTAFYRPHPTPAKPLDPSVTRTGEDIHERGHPVRLLGHPDRL